MSRLAFFVLPYLSVLLWPATAVGQQTGQEQHLQPGANIKSLLIDHDIPLIGGRWHGDVFVDAPLNGEPDGASVTLRRAKLNYGRGLGANWKLKLSANYNVGGGLELDNSYFVYSGWPSALLTIGIDSPPFSLESVSSASSLTFMETALAVSALSENKSGGIGFLHRTPRHIFNGMLVLFNVSQDDRRENGQGFVLHYVHSPIDLGGRDNDIHLGGSFSYRINADDDHTQMRSRPEIATVNSYFVDTGSISNSDRIIRASIEASRVAGRFSWQSEFLSGRVQRKGTESVSFWGAYAFVSWFLTNDSRNYEPGAGEFGPVTPSSPLFKGGRGAFELAIRASYIDLTDKDVTGGKESNVSLGLNWYLNQNLRVMVNLIKVLDVDRPGSEFDGYDPLIWSLRAQWLMN